MPKTTKNILPLTSEDVLDFFMKSEQFNRFELSEYVNSIWNNKWLYSELTQNLPYNSIVNKEPLKKAIPVICLGRRCTIKPNADSLNNSYAS